MARTGQRLAIVTALTASFIGYLLYTPNTGGIAQMNRLRTLSAVMKISHLLVCDLAFVLLRNILDIYRVQQPNDLVYRLVKRLHKKYLVCFNT